MTQRDYTCRGCGHRFPGSGGAGGRDSSCPRCGSAKLDANPWLLLGPGADALSDEDHYAAVLAV